MMSNGNGIRTLVLTIALLGVSLLANAWMGSTMAQRNRDREDIKANTQAVSAMSERLGRIETKVDILLKGSGE